MGFKVGDKVEVRSDLDVNLRYNNVNVSSDMVYEFAGSIVTIDKVLGTTRYGIEEDRGIWTWTTDMFVGIQAAIPDNKYRINKITGYGTVITLEDGTRIYQSKEGHVVQLSTNSTLS